jgi:hypothetical protein
MLGGSFATSMEDIYTKDSASFNPKHAMQRTLETGCTLHRCQLSPVSVLMTAAHSIGKA